MTDNNIFLLLYNSMSKQHQLVMKAICVFFVHMTAESRLKPYDLEERDNNVQGYPDSNTATPQQSLCQDLKRRILGTRSKG